ncbi:NKG2-A/NKG2-B type II integral membrane protein-like isoform X2 [Loxodonta africana]|uniref:NKG2-A/NKG2-B type II integral membrane protein-like isoform X2 n=1 Tax=Loxodonta africana TaxID=9785 RepID=UPI0030D0D6FD
MNNQTVTYSEVNLAKNSKRQQIKPMDSDRCISVTEQEITYVELNFHGASQDLQKNDKNFHCKGILISIIIAMIFLAIGTKKENPTQKASHCGRCPEDWLSYSNNCYYISSDKKNWTESQMACASKKSDLTYIDNEEEMKFIAFLSSLSWIGLSRKNRDYSWLWINGSPLYKELIDTSNNTYNCAMLFSSNLLSDSCGSSKTYICKHKILS